MGDVTVTLKGDSARAVRSNADDLRMTPSEYVAFCLNVVATLPTSLAFCISSGVPVEFYATAQVGEQSEGVDDAG